MTLRRCAHTAPFKFRYGSVCIHKGRQVNFKACRNKRNNDTDVHIMPARFENDSVYVSQRLQSVYVVKVTFSNRAGIV